MKKHLIGIGVTVLIFGGVFNANATIIKPSSVESSSTFRTYDVNSLINGEGLGSNGLHDSQYTGMWLSEKLDTTATLTFDLGQLYSLSSTYVWQYNFGVNDRGVKEFNILTSIDGNDFNIVKAGALLAESNSMQSIAAEAIDFSAEAAFVRFEIVSNHGNEWYTGLSEVQFEGVRVSSRRGPSNNPIPEPATMLLFATGFAGFIASRLNGNINS